MTYLWRMETQETHTSIYFKTVWTFFISKDVISFGKFSIGIATPKRFLVSSAESLIEVIVVSYGWSTVRTRSAREKIWKHIYIPPRGAKLGRSNCLIMNEWWNVDVGAHWIGKLNLNHIVRVCYLWSEERCKGPAKLLAYNGWVKWVLKVIMDNNTLFPIRNAHRGKNKWILPTRSVGERMKIF